MIVVLDFTHPLIRFLLVVFPVLSLPICLFVSGLASLLASSYIVNPVCIFGCASNFHKEKKIHMGK